MHAKRCSSTVTRRGSGTPKRLVGSPGSDEETPVYSPTGDQVAYKSNARVSAGESDPVRAHILRAHTPASEDELRVSRVAETWAAVSVSLMIISFVANRCWVAFSNYLLR